MAHGRWGLYLVLLLCQGLVNTAADTGGRHTPSGHGVQWKLGKYGSCSARCGGGLQSRRLRCVRRSHWRGRTFDRMLPAQHCPSPAPPVTRACNTHRCQGHWVKDEWSECSTTCGIGTQTREIHCESSVWSGHRVRLSRADCGGGAPVTSRRCYVKDCHHGDHAEGEGHVIDEEEYTLVQLRRAKRLTVTVGGTVKLLPGQTLEVKCPVRRFNKKFVLWSRDRRLVSSVKTRRVRAKLSGLLIRRANPRTDHGTYTCIASDKQATVNIAFIQKDDPDRRRYKHFQKHFSRQQALHSDVTRRQALHNDVTARRHNEIPAPGVTFPSRHQGDQSFNSSLTLTYIPGHWSACTATCRRSGQRKRDVTCAYVTSKYVKIVADDNCRGRGLSRPRDVESCSPAHDCPVWTPGPWSQCQPHCGRVGFKTRYLVCQWRKTGKPAFHSCDQEKKPATRKPCKPGKCPRECDDSSRYCSLARRLNMCRFASFRRQCCRSCHNHENLTF